MTYGASVGLGHKNLAPVPNYARCKYWRTIASLESVFFVDRGVRVGNRVKIQNGVSVYSGVTIEDDCFLGPHMVFTNDLVPRAFVHDFKITPTIVKKGTSIGANATIVCGVTLGEFSMIGAGSVVTKDVPSYTLVIGNPARVVELEFVAVVLVLSVLEQMKKYHSVLGAKKEEKIKSAQNLWKRIQ